MVSLEFNGLDADEIKRQPEIETLLVTRDNRTEVMKKVLDWPAEGINWGSPSLSLNTAAEGQVEASALPHK